jgi:hypothetical protein
VAKTKWLAIGIVILMLVLGGFWFYNENVTNPRVAQDLIDNPTGERAQKVMLLDLPSGRQLPVNYLHEGNKVFVGADGRWWRELDGIDVTITIKGELLTGHAVTILDDPDYTHDVFSRLRPTAPDWLPDWLNGKLIEITLGESS